MFNFNYEDTEIDVNEIDDMLGTINLVDIREPHEFKCGTIKTAKNIPMDNLLEEPEKYLDKNEKYYILCRSGRRSAMTCKELKGKGFNVIDVTGGVVFYEGKNRI